VLLVQYHQAQPRQGQKDGGAGSHHQPGATVTAAIPGLAPRPFAQVAGVGENTIREAAAAAIQQLGNQTDFRTQHEHVPPLGQPEGCCLEIDLRLAGTGDAPQQELSPQAGGCG